MGRIRRLVALLMFYPSLFFNKIQVSMTTSRWYDEIDEGLFLGGLPNASLLREIRDIGVSVVIRCIGEFNASQEMYESLGLEMVRIPMVDFVEPTMDEIIRGVSSLEQCAREKRSVYIHCKAGKGRSPTIVVCYLMKTKGMSPDEATDFVASRRRQTNDTIRTRRVVLDFYRNQNGEEGVEMT